MTLIEDGQLCGDVQPRDSLIMMRKPDAVILVCKCMVHPAIHKTIIFIVDLTQMSMMIQDRNPASERPEHDAAALDSRPTIQPVLEQPVIDFRFEAADPRSIEREEPIFSGADKNQILSKRRHHVDLAIGEEVALGHWAQFVAPGREQPGGLIPYIELIMNGKGCSEARFGFEHLERLSIPPINPVASLKVDELTGGVRSPDIIKGPLIDGERVGQ